MEFEIRKRLLVALIIKWILLLIPSAGFAQISGRPGRLTLPNTNCSSSANITCGAFSLDATLKFEGLILLNPTSTSTLSNPIHYGALISPTAHLALSNFQDLQRDDHRTRFYWNLSISFNSRSRWRLDLDSIPFEPSTFNATISAEGLISLDPGGRSHLIGVSTHFNHESDGQARHCLFGSDSMDCADPASDASAVGIRNVLNRTNGDYSSNQLGFGLRWIAIGRRSTDHIPFWMISASYLGQWQLISGPTGASLTDADAAIFGRYRSKLELTAEYNWSGTRLRTSAGAEHVLGGATDLLSFRGWLEATIVPCAMFGNLGFLIRALGGRDYQVPFSVDTVWQLMGGISIDGLSSLMFHSSVR